MKPEKMTPLFNVQDIDRSASFYDQLGFDVENT